MSRPVPALALPLTDGRIHWLRSIGWLVLLGPFFFLSYGYANSMAAARGVTDALFFEWERAIPFVPWSIVPYWSIDLLYGLSFLCCRSAQAVDRQAYRLLAAQCVSVACFLLFPLRFAFERPAADGLPGTLFTLLAGFDQPYNQAPSLHISLLVIIWACFARAVPGRWRGVVHVWALAIGLSVLTTYQHHFIDVPTGAAVGLLCLWLWPERGPSPLAGWRRRASRGRLRLAFAYLAGAALLAAAALAVGGVALWLAWPALALALVAFCYAGPGAAGFQKDATGHSIAARCLFAPYMLGAWLNSRAWTRRQPRPDAVCDGVWVGRMPDAAAMRAGGFAALFDLSAELPAPRGPWRYATLPWLDLVAPESSALIAAARGIEAERRAANGPLLVCCALGYSRSAAAVAAWLLLSGRAADVDQAVAMVARARPRVVLGDGLRAALAGCAAQTGSADE
ncbi:hypothetical protein dqs_0734 [Azoarcus olearius]|uniref:phosphatase PAP2/dual specificity phosphatase family protein n=1 Tax=Azoarcus sp. (strain BH72) TaxID=418699 RepID=UPI0008060EED|nr:phosphatase PAP2/dual specificity phosphatase family protein [Azoarcus olearius]ANQ83809.1 hypothetical protein dqs_0734 [Azoarcus olearius]